jgi:hypothetical protein
MGRRRLEPKGAPGPVVPTHDPPLTRVEEELPRALVPSEQAVPTLVLVDALRRVASPLRRPARLPAVSRGPSWARPAATSSDGRLGA